MPRLITSRLILAATGLLLHAKPGRTEPIQWDYSTFIFPSFVTPDSLPPSPIAPFLSASIGVNFQGNAGMMAGNSSIVFANMWTSGWLLPWDEVTFNHQPIQMAMGIHDWASNRSEVTLFTAYLDGKLSNQSANLQLTFADQSKFGSSGFRYFGKPSCDYSNYPMYSLFTPDQTRRLLTQLQAVEPHFRSLPGGEGSPHEQFVEGLLPTVQSAVAEGRVLWVQTDT